MTTRKKIWIGLASGAVSVIAITGVFVAIVVAQDSTESDGTSPSFAERVARILGLETQPVEDAISQAKKEIATEKRTNYLNAMVEKGALTQEEADELAASDEPIFPKRMTRRHGFFFDKDGGKGFRHFEGGRFKDFEFDHFEKDASDIFDFDFSDEEIESMLGELVAKEVITQAQSDELKTWIDTRPSWLEERMEQAMESDIDMDTDMNMEDMPELDLSGNGIGAMIDAMVDQMIDQLVSQEVVTQEEGNELKTWIDNRPDWIEERATELMGDGGMFDFDEKHTDGSYFWGKGWHDSRESSEMPSFGFGESNFDTLLERAFGEGFTTEEGERRPFSREWSGPPNFNFEFEEGNFDSMLDSLQEQGFMSEDELDRLRSLLEGSGDMSGSFSFGSDEDSFRFRFDGHRMMEDGDFSGSDRTMPRFWFRDGGLHFFNDNDHSDADTDEHHSGEDDSDNDNSGIALRDRL